MISEVELIKGDDLVLNCPVSGTPPLSIQWLKDDTVLQERGNRTIVIPAAQPSDSGNYTCLVANMAGEDSVTIAVSVNGECDHGLADSNVCVCFGYHCKGSLWVVLLSILFLHTVCGTRRGLRGDGVTSSPLP